MNKRTSLAAFLLILLFAGAADGLMDVIGPVLFLAVGAVVMGAALVLVNFKGGAGMSWYQYRGEWIPARPLEPPDCWREESGDPEEEEYDRAEDEMNGRFNRC